MRANVSLSLQNGMFQFQWAIAEKRRGEGGERCEGRKRRRILKIKMWPTRQQSVNHIVRWKRTHCCTCGLSPDRRVFNLQPHSKGVWPAVSNDGSGIGRVAGLHPTKEGQERSGVLWNAVVRPRRELELANFSLFTRAILKERARNVFPDLWANQSAGFCVSYESLQWPSCVFRPNLHHGSLGTLICISILKIPCFKFRI